MLSLTPDDEAEILAELERSPAARRELALSSPAFFDTYYCGMRYAAHREKWLSACIDLYLEAQETLGTDSPETRKLLLLGPRKHGKTEVIVTLAEQLICDDRDIRILIIAESQPQAKKRLARVKALLQSERIQADWCSAPDEGYGPFLPDTPTPKDGTVWDANQIRIIRSLQSIDPTVEAVGRNGATTGGHFDIIIADDPESRKDVASPTKREKLREWLGQTIVPMLNPGGLMIVIGTRKHHDDLYSHLIKDPTWRVQCDKAVIKWPESFEPVCANDNGRDVIVDWEVVGEPVVLWPEERPFKWLMNIRADEQMGPTGFAREFQNEVIDDGSAQFRMEWLEAAKVKGANLSLVGANPKRPGGGPWPLRMLVVQGADPAFVVDKRKAEAGDRDYAVIVTLGADVETRQRYVMHIHRERGDSKTQKKRNVARVYGMFAPPSDATSLDLDEFVANRWVYSVSMEQNNAGAHQSMDVTTEHDVPIYQFQNTRGALDPFSGVPVMAPLFELGKYTFPTADHGSRAAIDELVSELHGLGVAEHDDIAAALWIAELRLRQVLAQWEQHVEREAEFKRLGVRRIA